MRKTCKELREDTTFFLLEIRKAFKLVIYEAAVMCNCVPRQLLNDKSILFLLVSFLFLLSACQAEQSETENESFSTVHEFTGVPARLVWVQDLKDNRDVVAEGKYLRLMGYDSEDGKGERIILPGPENFMRPLFAPSGRKVIFSDFHKRNVQVVDWSGRNRKILTDGLAVATWRNSVNGVEWVYVARSPLSKSRGPTFRQLYRIQLEDPSVEELVWDETVFGAAVQLSGDGRRFSAEIPWPDCAVIDLEMKEARRYGKGCWPAIAPDQSYRFWFFDGAHRNLEMVDTRRGTQRKIPLTGAPGIDGNEVYHPRWSNHPRYMVMTGPYTIREGGNNIRGGGAGIEIYAGRFNESYTAVEAWVRVSNNQRADFYPDMWVARDEENYQKVIAEESASASSFPEEETWPIVNSTLLFAWDNVAANNEWRIAAGRLYQAEIVPQGRAYFALNYQMRIRQGWYEAKRFPEPDLQGEHSLEAIALEFVITIQKPGEQSDARLVSLGKEDADELIVQLAQGRLVLKERQKGEPFQLVSLGRMPVGKSHVLLQMDGDKVSIRVNTEPERIYPRKVPVITAWPLLFGDSRGGGDPASNILLERVALYTGKLQNYEIQQASQLFSRWQEALDVVRPVVVKAELLSVSAIPLPQDILPYRRGLVVNEYRIVEVVDGAMTAPVILVAHWAILGGEALDSAEWTKGEIYELRLDVFENRPELEGERLSMESDNLLLPMYYSIE